jgi:hypothetical protein
MFHHRTCKYTQISVFSIARFRWNIETAATNSAGTVISLDYLLALWAGKAALTDQHIRTCSNVLHRLYWSLWLKEDGEEMDWRVVSRDTNGNTEADQTDGLKRRGRASSQVDNSYKLFQLFFTTADYEKFCQDYNIFFYNSISITF